MWCVTPPSSACDNNDCDVRYLVQPSWSPLHVLGCCAGVVMVLVIYGLGMYTVQYIQTRYNHHFCLGFCCVPLFETSGRSSFANRHPFLEKLKNAHKPARTTTTAAAQQTQEKKKQGDHLNTASLTALASLPEIAGPKRDISRQTG